MKLIFYFLLFTAVFFSRSKLFALEYQSIKADKLTQYMMYLENISVSNHICRPELLMHLDSVVVKVGRELEKRLLKLNIFSQLGFTDQTGREDLFNQDMKMWELVLKENRNMSCRLVKQALAIAIYKISKLQPDKVFSSGTLDEQEAVKDLSFKKDQKRVLWELRFVSSEGVFKILDSTCKDDFFEFQNLSQSIKKRIDFISNGFLDKEGKRHFRRPIGRAEKMCARPVTAHFNDLEYMNNPESAIDQSILSKVNICKSADSVSKLRICLENLEQKIFEIRQPSSVKKKTTVKNKNK